MASAPGHPAIRSRTDRAAAGRERGASRERDGSGAMRAAGTAHDGDRDSLTELQRARMFTAMVAVARERGAGQATVAHIVARSGVSRRTFYELFDDREDCMRAAFDEAVSRAAVSVVAAFQGAGHWRERVRASLCALLEFLEDAPGLGAFCVVDALGAGPAALERRARVVEALVDAVDEGRAEGKAGLRPTRLTAEGVVGAVLGVLYARLAGRSTAGRDAAAGANGRAIDGSRRVARGSGKSIVELLGPMMAMIVLPYHGHAAAARELTRPTPKRKRAAMVYDDPLRDLDMRLTYRTLRVLITIAVHPDASNREIGDDAGVSDQGQISKLLARLEHLGLVRNHGEVSLRGVPNAWRLTTRGEEIERAIRFRAAPGEI